MKLAATRDKAEQLAPGLIIVAIAALAARFVSDHYGAPAMLMALLFGISLNFLSSEPRTEAGIAFSARTLLRIGVALLGFRISTDLIVSLGVFNLAVVISGVFATIGFGLLLGKFLRFPGSFAFLTAGSVAICGASAAMAIASLLPKDDKHETQLAFTVVCVTILSTVAMILYPILADRLGLSTLESGVFLGATIHDVAQVVGAGFSISEATGEVSTTVKLVRVALLAPVILVASMFVRNLTHEHEKASDRPSILPWFVSAFFAIMLLNSTGVIWDGLTSVATALSRWALLSAIVAVGMKTSIKEVIEFGRLPVAVLCLETIFIAVWVLVLLSVQTS
jgi:uncharacterized integral membrane protein (TIGR00698 family)